MRHFLNRIIAGKQPHWTRVVDEIDMESGRKIGVLNVNEYRAAVFPNALIQLSKNALSGIIHIKEVNSAPFLMASIGGVCINMLGGIRPDQSGCLIGEVLVNVRLVTPTRESGVQNAHLSIDVRHPAPLAGALKPELPLVLRLWNARSPDKVPDFAFDYRFGPDSKGGNIFVIL